jgi:hypothetical protein
VEITEKKLKAREAAASREKTAVTPEQDNSGQVLVVETPSGPMGESQGGISITLEIPIKSTPEAIRRAPQKTTGPLMWRLFPEELSAPPASTVPSRLEIRRGKRKRLHIITYKESVESGDIDESQHGNYDA